MQVTSSAGRRQQVHLQVAQERAAQDLTEPAHAGRAPASRVGSVKLGRSAIALQAVPIQKAKAMSTKPANKKR